VYGPPPHPDQIPIPAGLLDLPLAWLGCIAVGLALTAVAWSQRKRPIAAAALFSLGQVVALTSPLAALLPHHVYGTYPTIDKQGSLLFYLEGVHRHVLAHPLTLADYPPARLIGVHLGHLWAAELFDVFLEPYAAFNAQGLLWMVLAWWCAWGMLRALGGDGRVALVLSFPFAMGLHLFADLNWYTIEKAAVFTLPLYGTCWLAAARRGGAWRWAAAATAALATFLNLYLGMTIAVAAAVATVGALRDRRWLRHLAASYGLTLVLVAPLVVAQIAAMRGGPPLASPECFLETRAARDVFALWPPSWARLEAWRALNLVALGLAAWTGWRWRADRRVRTLALLAAVSGSLALGPRALGLWNPFYMVPWHLVPWFWRISEPEVFFWLTWLSLLGLASIGLARWGPTDRQLGLLYLGFVAAWLVSVRTHPAYPGFSEYVPAELADDWEQRLDQQPECPGPRDESAGASPPL